MDRSLLGAAYRAQLGRAIFGYTDRMKIRYKTFVDETTRTVPCEKDVDLAQYIVQKILGDDDAVQRGIERDINDLRWRIAEILVVLCEAGVMNVAMLNKLRPTSDNEIVGVLKPKKKD